MKTHKSEAVLHRALFEDAKALAKEPKVSDFKNAFSGDVIVVFDHAATR